MRLLRWLVALLLAAGMAEADVHGTERRVGTIRVATFNADMARKGAGVLIDDIEKRTPQILAVAEIILHARPDILLINEIDHDHDGQALADFAYLLAEGVGGLDGLDLPHRFLAPVNTGVPSGLDLDGDGKVMGARDALGYGRFPGQYGMAILSAVPLDNARTFQNFAWSKVPWAVQPRDPDGTAYYSAEAWARLPVSSKSHWDVTALLPDGRGLHLLASHPTPPVFDGPENRNGLRNAAEIRFWVDYIDGLDWMIDDAGGQGGLPPDAQFVVLGDLNADPRKGDGERDTVAGLAAHRRVQDPQPKSAGAAALGSPSDTADWRETNGPGNLRVDYVLPSDGLRLAGSGVFWPHPDDPLYRLVAIDGRNRASSDHRLVWVDIELESK